jgi:hypothetical protein
MQCSVAQADNCHGEKTFLTEVVILTELLSDNLSDVSMIFLIIARVTAMFLFVREKLCGWKQSTVTVKQAPRKVTVLQMRRQLRG